MPFALILLIAVLFTGCEDCCNGSGIVPSPGPIIVVHPSDGNNASVEWLRDATVAQARTDSPLSGGAGLREDFIGTEVKKLQCDGVEVDKIEMTLENGYGVEIRKTSLGLQWCFSIGGGYGCPISKTHDGSDKIPSDLDDPTSMRGDGTSCSEVKFQVEIAE
jgi:hypothetical protein